jgi:hypothetical protein
MHKIASSIQIVVQPRATWSEPVYAVSWFCVVSAIAACRLLHLKRADSPAAAGCPASRVVHLLSALPNRYIRWFGGINRCGSGYFAGILLLAQVLLCRGDRVTRPARSSDQWRTRLTGAVGVQQYAGENARWRFVMLTAPR